MATVGVTHLDEHRTGEPHQLGQRHTANRDDLRPLHDDAPHAPAGIRQLQHGGEVLARDRRGHSHQQRPGLRAAGAGALGGQQPSQQCQQVIGLVHARPSKSPMSGDSMSEAEHRGQFRPRSVESASAVRPRGAPSRRRPSIAVTEPGATGGGSENGQSRWGGTVEDDGDRVETKDEQAGKPPSPSGFWGRGKSGRDLRQPQRQGAQPRGLWDHRSWRGGGIRARPTRASATLTKRHGSEPGDVRAKAGRPLIAPDRPSAHCEPTITFSSIMSKSKYLLAMLS